MLSHKGVYFEDEGLTPEAWGAKKQAGETGEMGGLPIVNDPESPEVGRQQLSAIMRMYGMKFGYYPTGADDWKACGKIDEIVYTWADVLTAMGKVLVDEVLTDEEKGQKIVEIRDGILRQFLNICEKQLSE